MAINRDFIGREYRASATYEVGREHVRRFAEALGDPNPAYVDPDAARALGHSGLHRPADLPHGAELPVRPGGPDRGPGVRPGLLRVVHGEQRFELHRPVRVGDVLQMVSRVEDIKDAGRNELIAMAMEITGRDGDAGRHRPQHHRQPRHRRAAHR
jgi:acyl dehydratase